MLKERFLVDVKVDRTVECGDHAGCQTLRKETGKKSRSQCWISREQTFASLGIYLVQSCRIGAWGEKGTKKAAL